MIDLRLELATYAARVVGLDPRVAEVINRARPVFEDLGTLGGQQRGSVLAINVHATDEHQRNTLGHELAHLLDDAITGTKYVCGWGKSEGHGYSWAWWMKKLGLPPERFHDSPELMLRYSGAVYLIECLDCERKHVRTFVPRRCPAKDCESPDVRVDRADGIGGAR